MYELVNGGEGRDEEIFAFISMGNRIANRKWIMASIVVYIEELITSASVYIPVFLQGMTFYTGHILLICSPDEKETS